MMQQPKEGSKVAGFQSQLNELLGADIHCLQTFVSCPSMNRVTGMIRNVAVAAERTFSRLKEDTFKENYESLVKLVSKLNAGHVGLDADHINTCSGSRLLGMAPTATTILVHESENFTIGVFILGKNQKLPLHDHPNMFGIIKCIHGKLSIKSYSPLPTNSTYSVPSSVTSQIPREKFHQLTPCKFIGERIVESSEETVCSLDPDNGNVHEIRAIDGSAAFIDILSPPYDGMDRDCTYYESIESSPDKNDVTWLMATPPPRDYWTESADYRGPPIHDIK